MARVAMLPVVSIVGLGGGEDEREEMLGSASRETREVKSV